jgi:hypothetical protein
MIVLVLLAMLACEPDNMLSRHMEIGQEYDITPVEIVTEKPLRWFNARVDAMGRMDLGRADMMVVWHSKRINPMVVMLTWYEDDCEIAAFTVPANEIEFLLIASGHFS